MVVFCSGTRVNRPSLKRTSPAYLELEMPTLCSARDQSQQSFLSSIRRPSTHSIITTNPLRIPLVVFLFAFESLSVPTSFRTIYTSELVSDSILYLIRLRPSPLCEFFQSTLRKLYIRYFNHRIFISLIKRKIYCEIC
jgi:hypothetical protein